MGCYVTPHNHGKHRANLLPHLESGTCAHLIHIAIGHFLTPQTSEGRDKHNPTKKSFLLTPQYVDEPRTPCAAPPALPRAFDEKISHPIVVAINIID